MTWTGQNWGSEQLRFGMDLTGDGTFQPAQFVREDVGGHTGPFVQSITIDFHTLNDDLDHDTELHVFVKNRRSDSADPDGPSTFTSNLQAYRDHDADWYNKNPYLGYAINASQGKTLKANSTHRVTIQLRSQPISVEELLLPAVHLHILTVGNDRWKFDYTLTITLDDGTVLPPFNSNINGLTGIILDQDNRNYYGICSDVRPTPPRTEPGTDSKLTGVTIEFHTHNDDKDADTKLGIRIINRVSASASQDQDIVVANGVATGRTFPDSDKSDTPIDERYTRIDLPLASNAILLRKMVLPVVFINIAPKGNDRWIFDYRVTLMFGNEQPYSWTVSGIILDEKYHKHMGIYNGRPFPTLYAPKAMLSPTSIQCSKTISLAFLQQKLDELLNRRQVKGSPDPLLILFWQGHLTAVTQTVAWSIIFFFASAGASSAYLTVSEIFPLEIRAMAIAVFFVVGQGSGVLAPWFFSMLIQESATSVFYGDLVGAALMLLGAAVALIFGVKAEQKPLEALADPISAAR